MSEPRVQFKAISFPGGRFVSVTMLLPLVEGRVLTVEYTQALPSQYHGLSDIAQFAYQSLRDDLQAACDAADTEPSVRSISELLPNPSDPPKTE